MRCVADFEVRSDLSVVADDLILTINEPHGAFKARIKNIPRTEFTKPFLLSIHLYFEAPNLQDAEEHANELLARCLNILAFSTGSGLRKHRVRQIADAEQSKDETRDVRMWSQRIEYDDPQPFLQHEIAKSIERLLEFSTPPAIQRALRWYRLGIDASAPDDQFIYFWFAIEIVAEFQKSTEKVNDKCPQCRSPLYCETCEKYPVHKPYAKQAIRELMRAADENYGDETLDLLDETRNDLMHGLTLKEIESKLPDPHESVVDLLGKILWKALLRQFPPEMFDGTLKMGTPSTYLHYKAHMVAHIRTVIPADQDGYLNLEFNSVHVEAKPPGPPQSALPFVVRMTKEQYQKLKIASDARNEYRDVLERIRQHVEEKSNLIYARVLATDMFLIRQAISSKGEGEWQALFKEIIDPIEVKQQK